MYFLSFYLLIHSHCRVIDAVFYLDEGELRVSEPPELGKTDALDQPSRSPRRYLQATLIARLFEIFPLTCRYCGAEMNITAFVIETPSVQAVLEHIGEPPRPPVIYPARAPPAWKEDPIALDLGDDPLAQPEPEIEFDQRIQW